MPFTGKYFNCLNLISQSLKFASIGLKQSLINHLRFSVVIQSWSKVMSVLICVPNALISKGLVICATMFDAINQACFIAFQSLHMIQKSAIITPNLPCYLDL